METSHRRMIVELTINERCYTKQEAAYALRRLAGHVDVDPGSSGKLRNADGEMIGHWRVESPP